MTYPEAAVTLSYFDNTDRVGTITRASSFDNQAIAFSYDGFLTTRIAYSGVANGEYRYAFDNNFWVTGISLDNVWTALGRDNDGLLTQYGPFTITRNGPAGSPSALTDNVLNVNYTYDSSGRLATRTYTVAAIPVYQIQLGYDNVGRIAQKIETVSGVAHTFDYTYDLDGQLFEVRKDGVLVEQYGYDPNGNRTSTLAASATYDAQDRLIQQGGVAYTLDADGYLVQRGADTFQYSARGELLSATVGGQTITYQYDGVGRRIGKTDTAGVTQYLYCNPGNPFQLTASRGVDSALTNYFYDTAGNLYALERGGVRYYVATDQLGTPKVVTDGTGAVVKTVEYDAWGTTTSDSNPSFDLPIGFAGGIADEAAGLVRFGYRDYEPRTGRWSARDLGLFAGGQANLYSYVEEDPVNWVDLYGLEKINLIGKGDPNYGAAERYPDIPGELHIFAHGNTQMLAGRDPQSLAKYIRGRKDKWRPGMPVFLHSCRAAEGEDSYAKQLADLLQTKVTGPDTPLYLMSPFGVEWAYGNLIDFGKGRGVPNPLRPGAWTTFGPK